MRITNIKDCPFTPSHIEGKKIRFVIFNQIAVAF